MSGPHWRRPSGHQSRGGASARSDMDPLATWLARRLSFWSLSALLIICVRVMSINYCDTGSRRIDFSWLPLIILSAVSISKAIRVLNEQVAASTLYSWLGKWQMFQSPSIRLLATPPKKCCLPSTRPANLDLTGVIVGALCCTTP